MDSAVLYRQIDMPFAAMFATAVILLLSLPTAAVIGYWTGATRRRSLLAAGREIDHVVGETTLGAIIGILSLLMAFSFGNALSLAQSRESALINEANAIGTAFLRADLLPDPGRTALQRALLDYAETRVLPGDGSIVGVNEARAFIRATLVAQARLWPLTLEVTQDPVPVPIRVFVSGAMNDVLDAHFIRMENLSNPVSNVVSAMLIATAMTALFLLGNRAGLVGRALTWRIFLLSGFLFLVMITIADIQRPSQGLVRTDDIAMRATIFDMTTALDGRL